MRQTSDARTAPSISKAFGAAATSNEAKTRGRPTPPFSLRLTFEERERLQTEANGKPLGAHIRSRLFGDQVSPRRKRRRPVADHEALARVLAKLGQSHLAGNINQLAKAANTGVLPLGPETETALRKACADIAAMRRDLMTAIGISAE